MRNKKVKLFKKCAVLTALLLFMSAGASFADANWDNFTGQAATSPNNMQLNGNATATSTLNLGAPPVPGGTAYNVNGGNNTINGTGYAGSMITNGSSANTTITNTNFSNGTVNTGTGFTNGGGAIHNSGNLTVTSTAANPSDRTSFTNNTGVNGGAILNTGTGTLDINNVDFTGNRATATTGTNVAYGGAIFNGSTAAGTVMTIANSTFTNNSATMAGGGYGGAVYHDHGVAVISGSEFITNNATSEGGAIANKAVLTINGNSVFDGNFVNSQGGAITNGFASATNPIDATLTISDTTFRNNHSGSSGGAIFNKVSYDTTTHKLVINSGTKFESNYVATTAGNLNGSGAAIMNDGALSNDRKDAVLEINGGNSASEKVVFKNNIASNGGAVYNRGVATINNAVFDSNGIEDPNNRHFAEGTLTQNGGAIYNEKTTESTGEMTIRNSQFVNNTVAGNGGAVYNASKVTIIDSDFAGNKAGSSHSNGGAIYTSASNGVNAETIIRAENRDVNIGTADSVANVTDSIYLQGTQTTAPATTSMANATLQANSGRTVNINSNIIGSRGGDGTLLANVNVGDSANTYTGTVRVNGDAKIQSSNVNIYSGTLAFAQDNGLDATNILNMHGGTLDLLNGQYGAHQLQARQLNLLGNAGIKLDVDLANEKMDGIFKNNFAEGITNAGGHKLTVEEMYAWTDTNKKNVEIQFTDADALIGNVVQGSGAKIVQSPTSKYAVTQYDKPVGSTSSTGDPDQGVYYGFQKIGDSDPAISGAVAAQGAFLIMDNLYRQSFANMDMVTLMSPEQRLAWKMRNKYANAGYHTGVYAPNVIPEERDGWYMRPFSNFENVPLKNGPKVSNVSYGTLIGGESDLIDLGHGWDGNFSVFGAYSGSHQAYNGVSIWQNAGTLGAVGTAYKGNFWTGVTANVGASAAEAHHGFGNDQFPILMTGAAWKSGYNWGLFNNKFIIQPNYMMSYTFVNVFDYNSASGARITQDPLNAIEIVPGIRLIGNLKNGWQPYLGVNMTWNIMDKTKFYANEVALTPLSVKPYIEYGVGLQKRYGDRFTGFGQAMIRNGGRNGIALTMGFRWALGH